jgi:hypothetical protein
MVCVLKVKSDIFLPITQERRNLVYLPPHKLYVIVSWTSVYSEKQNHTVHSKY